MNTETKPKMVRIVAAVVDTRHLTLYKEDGETITIPQGDPRLRGIVEAATPQLIRQGWAEIVINPEGDNSYAKFEQEGSGTVKFFRIAKAKLLNLFTPVMEQVPINTLPVPPLSIGTVPVQAAPAALPAVLPAFPSLLVTMANVPSKLISDAADATEAFGDDELERFAEEQRAKEAQPPKVEQTMAAIDEIMKHAVPVQSDGFHETDVAVQGRIAEASGTTIKTPSESEDTHTIIAVVDNKIIPGMEMIKTQFGRAAKMGSTVGVENFLRRLASVIEQRKHSVEDLLKFMERADLPIADDGTILIYKVLSKKDGAYVDCHSKKVRQFVGAHVCMDVKLVDHNRNNECSNGLHVARRGYIREFSGDVCVLAKLAPEDVIAVPSYDANKMRVCGYHIIAELDNAQYTALRNNQPITDSASGKQLLALALAGNHIHKTHEVRITEQMGGGVVVTKLEKLAAKSREELSKPLITEGVAEALANPEAEALDQSTDPLDVVKAVEKATLSRAEQARALYQAWLDAPRINKDDCYAAVLAYKKTAKVSWERLGIPDLTQPAAAKAKKGNNMAPQSVFKAQNPTPSVFTPVDVTDKRTADENSNTVNNVELDQGSYRERIHKLLAIGLTSIGTAAAIIKIKQQSKKSWTVLGVSAEQVAAIQKCINGDGNKEKP